MIDATEGITGQDQRLAERIDAAGCPILILLNKWELIDDPDAPPGDPRRAVAQAGVHRRRARCSRSRRSPARACTSCAPCCRTPSASTTAGCRPATSTGCSPRPSSAQPAGGGAKVLYAVQGATDPPTFTLFANREIPADVRALPRALDPRGVRLRLDAAQAAGQEAGRLTMPWCEDCEKYWAPSAMTPEGECPDCGADLDAPEPVGAGDADDDERRAVALQAADRDARRVPRVPRLRDVLRLSDPPRSIRVCRCRPSTHAGLARTPYSDGRNGCGADRAGRGSIGDRHTGCGAAWLARLTGGQEVGSSNLPSPTARQNGPRSNATGARRRHRPSRAGGVLSSCPRGTSGTRRRRRRCRPPRWPHRRPAPSSRRSSRRC